MIIKKIQSYCFLIIIMLVFFKTQAQQTPQFTQYMYNTISINPAYTNEKGGLEITGLHRNQWVGIDSSPKTYMFSLNSSIKDDKMNIGLSTIYDDYGITKDIYINIDYSYGILFYNGSKLSFGIKGGINSRSNNYDELNFYQQNDPNFDENSSLEIRPSLGFGAYFNSESFYAGLSTSNVFSNYQINTNIPSETVEQPINYYLIAGYIHEINENFKLKPSLLFKYVEGASLQLDLSLNTLLYNKVIFGAAYRHESAISGMFGFQLNKQCLIGMAYDKDTSELSQVENNSGSFELFLKFNFFNSAKRHSTPRFF